MSNGSDLLPPPADSPDVRSILDPLKADRKLKSRAWEAYHSSDSPESFQKAFDSIDIPKEAKAALWNSKFKGGHVGTSRALVPPPPSGGEVQPKRIEYGLAGQAVESLPAAGMTIGGIAASEGGPLTGAFGAGLGGAAGESLRQLIRRKQGKQVPATSGEAALDITKEAGAGALTELISRGGARLLRPVGKYFSETAARSTRLPMLPSEAGVGGPAGRTVEAFLSHALPSRGILEAFRSEQMAAAERVAGEEAARISRFRGTPEEAGQLYQRALDQGRARMKAEVNSAYKAIDDLTASTTKRVPVQTQVPSGLVDAQGNPMMVTKTVFQPTRVGGVRPETKPLKRTATRLLREIEQQEKLMDPKLLADTRSTLEQIINAPDKVDFQTMAKSRSDLLAITRKLDDALPGKRAGTAKLLAKEMDDAMITAAEKSGITGLPDQIRAANALTKEMHRKFEQQLITKMLEAKNPEVLTGYIRKAGLQEIRDLNAIITEPQRRVIQSQVVHDALDGAFDPQLKRLDPKAFAQEIYDMGEARGKEIFGRNYQSIKQLADMVGKLKGSQEGGAAAALHNYAYLAALPSAIAAVTFGRPEAAAITAGGVAVETFFLRRLASALTNPARSARTIGYIQLGARGAPYAIYGLAKLLNSEAEESEAFEAAPSEVQRAEPAGGAAVPPPPGMR